MFFHSKMFSLLVDVIIGTPSYVARIMPGRFPKVLRNMHYPAIILNALMMLLLLAVAPVNEILSGANVLSLLAEKVYFGSIHTSLANLPIISCLDCWSLATDMGRGRRDHRSLWWRSHRCDSLHSCIDVESKAVFIGILSACELFQQLSQDRVIPTFFLRVLPLTGSPYVSVLTFAGFSGLIYATTGANLVVISEM